MNELLNVGHISEVINTMVSHHLTGNTGMYDRIKAVCIMYLTKVHRELPNILFGQLIDNEVKRRIQIMASETTEDFYNNVNAYYKALEPSI